MFTENLTMKNENREPLQRVYQNPFILGIRRHDSCSSLIAPKGLRRHLHLASTQFPNGWKAKPLTKLLTVTSCIEVEPAHNVEDIVGYSIVSKDLVTHGSRREDQGCRRRKL